MSDVVCKECIFAEYKDDTQIGCTKNRLEVFKEVGEEILECYDKEKEFFVIKNRNCAYFRNQQWLDVVKNVDEQLAKELKLYFSITIFIENNTMEELRKTLSSINHQIDKPLKVNIICDTNNRCDPRIINNIMYGHNIKWSIYNKIKNISNDKAMIVLQNDIKKYNFLSIIKCGETLPVDYFKNINYAVIEKMIRFALIRHPFIDTIQTNVFMHWYFNRNQNMSVIDSILDYQTNTFEQCVYSLKEIECLNQE